MWVFVGLLGRELVASLIYRREELSTSLGSKKRTSKTLVAKRGVPTILVQHKI